MRPIRSTRPISVTAILALMLACRLSAAVAAQSTSADSANLEPMGPSSRRGPLVISEIMHQPAKRTDGRKVEFVELYNSQPWDENIGGHKLTGDIEYTFPPRTIFPALSYLVVARVPADVQAVYGLSAVFGPFDGQLSRNSGKLRLLDEIGSVLFETEFDSRHPWPATTDGAGHSLVLARPSYGEANPRAWAQSDTVGGTPGTAETAASEPLRAIVINELLVRGTAQSPAFVELYNHGTVELDLSDCVIASDKDEAGFVIPPDSKIAPGGFWSIAGPASHLDLSLSDGVVYLWSTNRTRVLDAVNYEATGLGQPVGRIPDGARGTLPLARPTPGGANSGVLESEIVINEIMYDPISGNPDDEYVELFNRGTQARDLGGWQFVDGIDFTFATNTLVPPKGYLVVARNIARLLSLYPHLNAVNTVGGYSGSLSRRGEHLALARPELNPEKNKPTQMPVVVDEVSYGVGGRWGQWARGGGSSLELVDARGDHRLAGSWADSDETRRSAWTTVEFTGKLEGGTGAADSIQVMLMGEGECLLDNVQVIGSSLTNQVVNGDFEQGMTNWVAQGTQVRSTVEDGTGVDGSRCLHIRASSEGDTGANRIRARITGKALTANQTATLRAQVRWLRGHPELLLRLKGNHLEAVGNILTTTALGTPGLPNSRAVDNAGPAIYEVSHAPVMPAINQRVLVTARLGDPDGIGSARLFYRVDPATTYRAVTVVDDGTAGDLVAGDGIYTGAIPGQALNTMVAFYIQAEDGATIPAGTAFPDNAPSRECLVRFGDPKQGGSFGTYRLWLTQKTVDTWAKRENLSREPLDGTFVYGDYRVVYNCTGRYSGSPYHQGFSSPVGNPCQYSLDMPEDDQVLGTSSFNKIHTPGNSPLDDATIQTEQTAYWLARQLGLPYNYKRNVQMFVNGVKRGALMEDTLVPSSNMLEQFFPEDNDGDLHKLYGWFEFDNNTSVQMSFANNAWATLQSFTRSNGAKNQARYRWTWRPRAVNGSANNFTNLYALVDAVNRITSKTYVPDLLAQADIEQWMRTFAVEHAVGNWDSYGNQNGQNMYAYKPRSGPWSLLIWDLNIVLGNSGSNGPSGDDLFQNSDPVLRTVYQTPVFRRMYWRALKELVEGPMLPDGAAALMEARYAAYRASNVKDTGNRAPSSPKSVQNWIASRRNYILTKLRSVSAEFAVTDAGGADLSVAQNPFTLKGSAPVEVRTILVNGVEFPITWTSVTNWSIQVPLTAANSTLVLQGVGQNGQRLASAATSVNVRLTNPSSAPPIPVTINEWMPANQSVLKDPLTGDYQPWFELHNPTSATVDLGGWSLTDQPGNPALYRIQNGVSIPARSFLLVWADESVGDTTDTNEPHASFTLSRSGGAILLYSADGKLVDAVNYGPLPNDISEGRRPDSSPAPFVLLSRATPAGLNASATEPVSVPTIIKAEITGNGVTIHWVSQPGRRYHVQYTRDLNQPEWFNLNGDVVAGGTTAAKTDATVGSASGRFYRVEVVD